MNKLANKLSIILINTQLPENLGSTARAMLNFKFHDLRVVNPKFSLKNEKIIPVSAGADSLVEKIKRYNSFEDSIKDLNYIIGCTVRKRSSNKICLNIEEIKEEINQKVVSGNKVGIVFGPENSGLTNEHLALVDVVLSINTNPSFSSLNLSHAVMIICYELSIKTQGGNEKNFLNLKKLAKKKELISFFLRLEILLKESGFIKTQERRLTIISKIRNIFSRLSLTSNELNTLVGIISSLSRKK